MATRERNPELQALFDAGIEVNSFSKLSTIENCLYEAYLTYKKRLKGKENVYSILGSNVHDTLERIMNDEATEEDLLPALQTDLDMCDSLGIEFPKDKDGGSIIRDGWISSMTHFCNTFSRPKGDGYKTETFFLYKSPEENYVQGYIDVIRHKKDNHVSIFDWKTSSLYKGEDLKAHANQLLIYGLALEQQGYVIDNVAWIFLKYVKVKFTGKARSNAKNETEIEKVVERRKIVKELQKHIEYKLEKLGYNEFDIEMIMKKALCVNEIPQEIASEFKITPHMEFYPYNEETKQDAIKFVDEISLSWKNKSDNELDYPPRKFTKTLKNGKESEDIFYCTQLCGHRDRCKYLQDYLVTKDVKGKTGKHSEYDDEDLF